MRHRRRQRLFSKRLPRGTNCPRVLPTLGTNGVPRYDQRLKEKEDAEAAARLVLGKKRTQVQEKKQAPLARKLSTLPT